MKLVTVTLVFSMILACSGGTDPVLNDIPVEQDLTATPDGASQVDLSVEQDVPLVESDIVEDVFVLDLPLDKTAEIPFPTCDPGTGCFLDSCTENGQCLSGWCVEHMGDGVCTMLCQEECPDGWSCKTVGTGPDVVSICISAHSNLCKPCASNADCKSPGGAEDVCVDYGPEGNFCGGTCQEDKDCPWGFSCTEQETVDGILLLQCVSETGSCPCTPRSVTLALSTPCEVGNEEGTCAGKRVCTEDGLSDCDAATPGPEECNGMDDNCDGDVDEPAEVGGDYVNLCSDDNDCTEDTCLGADGCTYEVLTEGECIDGDACTVGDHCEEGTCVGNPVACDDDNPCTDDSCDGVGGCLFENNKEDCDDEDPCTVADECNGGVCSGVAVACECQTDEDCETLDDGDLCTGTLFCDTENLPHLCATVPDSPIACPDPETGPDEVCLKADCDPDTGGCSLMPDHEGFACEDGDKCTVGDTCQQGSCTAGQPQSCNDGNPCTDDSCVPDSGCVYEFNDADCSDGNVCTVGDQCVNGQCQQGDVLDCGDDNVCNGAESCDPDVGCQPGLALQCNDGNSCNGVETCDPQLGCQAGVGGSCDDQNPCTDDTCDELQGCIHSANQAACDDGNLCTIGDHCDSGQCAYESLLTCKDDNPCTDSACDPAQGCVTTLNSAPCDDDDVCTTGDHCHLGECIFAGDLPCDDGNPCTDDSCEPNTGCQFLANQESCNDGNECTTGDVCKNGICSFTGFASCDDGEFCNGVEVCDPDLGCTAGDPPDTADGKSCTVDSCDEQLDVIVHVPDDAFCNDDQFCNGVETCDLLLDCVAGVPPTVEDLVDCTIDKCDEENDVVLHIPDDGACVDSDVCNGLEYCNTVAGCASGTPLQCDDQVVCTDDSCDAIDGCKNEVNNGACDDSNPCTDDACDPENDCQQIPVQDATPCTTSGGLDGECAAGQCEAFCQPGTHTFSFTGGAQTLNLPACATAVTIEAWGAEGGDEESGKGGKGAYIKGTFDNLANKTLEIHVGEQGRKGTCGICGGGGGGGSFVWQQSGSVPVLIAGGGGGASYQGDHGKPGLTSEQGGPGGYYSVPVGQGGHADNGGGGGCGCGGGGWNGDGTGNSWCTGGKAKGGPGGVSDYMGHGGWSSGGAAFHGGGGGGGYTGGSGGTYPTGGGGGGSYNAGSDKSGQAGANSGNGKVIISW